MYSRTVGKRAIGFVLGGHGEGENGLREKQGGREGKLV